MAEVIPSLSVITLNIDGLNDNEWRNAFEKKIKNT